MISFIVAMDDNRVIGKDNQLPWRLPEDLKFFKKITMGHPVAMGRKTHESIGKLLPGRENIVITRNLQFQSSDCRIFNSIQEFVRYGATVDDEVFVIGGAEIFSETLPFADRLYITRIHQNFAGDTFFPDLAIEQWKLLSFQKGIRDDNNPYDYDFSIYERKEKSINK